MGGRNGGREGAAWESDGVRGRGGGRGTEAVGRAGGELHRMEGAQVELMLLVWFGGSCWWYACECGSPSLHGWKAEGPPGPLRPLLCAAR